MSAQPQEESKVLVFDPARVSPRRKWLLAAAGIAVAIAAAAAVWMSRASAPKAVVPLATRTSVPQIGRAHL